MSTSNPANQALIDQFDALLEKKDFPAMYALMIPHKESRDANVMWRLARATLDCGKMKDGDEKKKLVLEAWDYISKALELDENNFNCQVWYGILLNLKGEYGGTKEVIANSYKIKEHFTKALELSPDDPTALHSMGMWCFTCTDIPWAQRKLASVIFTTPPTSSFEEALEYFKKAEEAEPDFYNMNKVMLGKTYLKLKDKEAAKAILLKAWEHKDVIADDKKARKEAKNLLKECGVKM